MKYTTTIKITCDAVDKEDALYVAGEFLRNNVEGGVSMSVRTETQAANRLTKIGGTCLLAVFVFSAILMHSSALFVANGPAQSYFSAPATSTVTPELKTQDGTGFKRSWQKAKDAAILNYIKS
ncbi:MAG: hypothetical protein HQL28_01845 [Candidatus Omnitrophica bacterium]|nr:hypothetical protein [Candidatus Omnitrophota bacterium]